MKLRYYLIIIAVAVAIVFLLTRYYPFLDTHAGFYSGTAILIASIVAALIALYLGSWRDSLRKPKLELCFNENGEEPYAHKISFGLLKEIELSGQILKIYLPGFNSRVLVYNKGKSTAKNVQSRVEKIELLKNGTPDRTLYYHPTRIKWSGEPVQVQDWNPVDIPPKSHFFMDLFRVINETTQEIVDFNYDFYGRKIEKEHLAEIVKVENVASEDIYWNIWVKDPKVRGIRERYGHEGYIVIYFVIVGENCDPLKFQACIDWNRKNWHQPKIRIMHNNNFVKDCIDEI